MPATADPPSSTSKRQRRRPGSAMPGAGALRQVLLGSSGSGWQGRPGPELASASAACETARLYFDVPQQR